jgi:hypothetical protein
VHFHSAKALDERQSLGRDGRQIVVKWQEQGRCASKPAQAKTPLRRGTATVPVAVLLARMSTET